MEWLDRLSAKKGAIGIELLPEGFTIAALGCLGDAKRVDYIHVAGPGDDKFDPKKALHHYVHKHKIQKRLCHVILSHKDYQLLLVEAPDVPDEDLREAIKWKVKDLINMPVESAVVDVVKLPADANRSSKTMVYVAVANLDRVKPMIEWVNDSGLTLSSIDIPEMALRNLSVVLAEDMQERGVGVVRIHAGGGVICLYKDKNLYLSRQFKLAYNGGLLDDLPEDALGLELQRSLDYYERQMGIAPPVALFICGESISEDKITQNLSRAITVPVKYLNVTDNLSFREEVDDGITQLCAAALGAAHRDEVAK